MIPRSVGFFIVSALLIASPASAQDALVLSGGGSRGLTHVGVLTALEDHGFNPDIIVGTSMGAVVGALYAAGYTPEEIRDRVLAVNWARVFDPSAVVVGPDRVPRFPMITFDLDTDELRFSRGIIAQWRINRELVRLLFDANARAAGDFDRLPRRFRAVATDLLNGDAVVLEGGDLARAVRASMAVPGMFAPILLDGRVLIDGGIVENVPSGVAREMGADVIVAVDAGKLSDEMHDLSALAVLRRSIDLMQENFQDPGSVDLVVEPDLGPEFVSMLFPDDPSDLFPIGYDAVGAAIEENGGLPWEPGTLVASLSEAGLPTRLSALVVQAPDSATASLTRRIFNGVVPGPFDPGAILRAVDLLYTTGLFEAIWPTVRPDSAGGDPILHIRIEAPPGISLAGAAAYDNDLGGRAWVAVSRYASVARRPAVFTAAAASEGLERWLSTSLLVYPRNRPAFSWSTGLYARERDVRAFDTELDAILHDDVLRLGGWVALQLPFILRERTATLSAVAERLSIEDGASGWTGGPILRFTGLNPDALIVGVPMLVEIEQRWGDFEYTRVALAGSRRYEPPSTKYALSGVFGWVSDAAPIDVIPALGDDHAVPGLRWGELRGRTRLAVGADAAHPIGNVHARLRVRTGAVAPSPESLTDARWVTGAELAGIWRFPIATAEAGFGVNTRGDRRFEIMIGRRF